MRILGVMPGTTALSPAEIDAARAAALCVVRTHERLAQFIRAGRTLAQIDAEVARVLTDLKCDSCFRGYRVGRLPPFPSHACLSLNDCIVHGTAAYELRPLERGDLFKLDIGVKHRGWIGDAAWTYSIGEPGDADRRLMECGKECLRRGLAALKPGAPFMDWARAVQNHAEQECRFHVVEELGGHGYGRVLHDHDTFVPNAVPRTPHEMASAMMRAEPGMLLAVEPMISIGTRRTVQKPGTWPIRTADGSRSVHYEADVMVTDDGIENLTAGMWNLPDVVG